MTKIKLSAVDVRAAMAHQSNDPSREILNGILLAKNGDIVSSDGTSLFLAKGSMDEENKPTEDTVIKLGSAVPISTEWLEVDLDGTIVECWSNAKIKKRIPFQIVLGTFPDYEQVLPSEPGIDQPYNDTVYLTAKMLQKLAKTWGKDTTFKIKSNGVNCPLTVTSTEHNGLIVVMPCRVVKCNKSDRGHELIRSDASVPLARVVA